MAFVNDTILMANKALNGIGALARQAKSYSSNPSMLRAKSVASSIANSGVSTLKAARNPMMIGAGVGAAAGAGYNYASDPRASARSMIGAGIKGGALGAAGGLGYYGVRAAGGPRAIMGMAKSRATSAYGSAKSGWAGMVSKASAGGYKY